MPKDAWLAATLLVAASTAMAANIDAAPGAAPAGEMPCRVEQSLELACTLRAVDADGDGTISAAELANLAEPFQPVVDWTPLHAPRHTGLDFKDAATDAGSVLPAAPERAVPKPLIPALVALGALVILLRGRPN